VSPRLRAVNAIISETERFGATSKTGVSKIAIAACPSKSVTEKWRALGQKFRTEWSGGNYTTAVRISRYVVCSTYRLRYDNADLTAFGKYSNRRPPVPDSRWRSSSSILKSKFDYVTMKWFEKRMWQYERRVNRFARKPPSTRQLRYVQIVYPSSSSNMRARITRKYSIKVGRPENRFERWFRR